MDNFYPVYAPGRLTSLNLLHMQILKMVPKASFGRSFTVQVERESVGLFCISGWY